MTPLPIPRRAASQDVVAALAARSFLARGARSPLPLVEDVATPAVVDDEDDDGCAARGWYASSWDLRCGLEVREDLPLDSWFVAQAAAA